ncbi:MAG TPA: EAL domain-containing protein [Actinocrinis sp.]|nr:EAL domain-containing protein [Actinocrinis sp.]
MTPPPADLATAWAHALTGASSVPMTAAQTREFVTQLAEWVGQAADPELARKTGIAVASALVDAHYTQPDSLAATLTVLDENWPAALDPRARTALRSGLAAGYADALRERTRAEQELIRQAVLTAHRTSEARFRAVFRNAALGIGIADGEGRVLELNQRLAHMLGLEARSARGRDIRELKQLTDPPEYWAAQEQLLAGERPHYSADKQFTRPDGTIIWTRMRASTVRSEDGSVALLIAVFEDITERRQMNQQLLYQATHDPLTGLPNRTRLLEQLSTVLREAGPAERVGLCFIDLDGFKGVNDTLGHEAGDRLLATVARRLSAAVDSEHHLVARMGGDEFVILVPHTSGPASVTEVAEAALASFKQPIVLDDHRLTITASIGLVERPVAGTEPTELLRAADITLYWAKSDGKACWALFDPERNAREVERYALSQSLPAALERGELFLEYQPIVDLSDGQVHVLEALVRWNHPVRGLLGPGEFVPLAEETGAIVALGRWVLRRAVADAANWPAGPYPAWSGAADDPDCPITVDPPAVAVNVAVRQVREGGLLAEVHEALAAAGLPPDRLHLEITESAVMDPGESGRPALATLHELADSGVKIAIDDFGTGYSNLAYLRRLPAHTLKIDSSFVAALPADGSAGPSSAEAIVTSLITLAHACGMIVTAEGVETRAQADRLRELGADQAQGYYYSPPVRTSLVADVLDEVAQVV